MDARLKLYGAEQLLAQLRSIAEKVPENGRKVMHATADKIVERAKLFCPVDTGALEDSIHKEVTYEERGRLGIDIVAGGVVDGVDTDSYASEINENYRSMHPGINTELKMQANPGVEIGEHFLERAVEEQDGKLQSALIEATLLTMSEESR